MLGAQKKADHNTVIDLEMNAIIDDLLERNRAGLFCANPNGIIDG